MSLKPLNRTEHSCDLGFTQWDVVLHHFVNQTSGSTHVWMQEGAVADPVGWKVEQQLRLLQLGRDLQQFLLSRENT